MDPKLFSTPSWVHRSVVLLKNEGLDGRQAALATRSTQPVALLAKI
jgi:hypothetical protein